MIERTTVRLPTALLNRARKKAAAEGTTLTALIEEGLQLALRSKRETQPEKSKRRTLTVSSATGWLLPGASLERMADYYEQEDIEYMERMRRGFQE
jgi:hypothetical protein